MDLSAMPLTAPSKASSLPSPHSAEDQHGNQAPGSEEATPPLPAIAPSLKLPSQEAVRRANKRSLADTVKMRTRGALAEDTATAEAPPLEAVAKKRAKAAKGETGGTLPASPRAQPPTHSHDAEDPNILNGRGDQDETGVEDLASSPGAAPDGLERGAQAEARQAAGDAGATQAHAGQAAGRKGGGKSERKVAPSPTAKVGGDIHCHYCGTRESTYWRRGPDGPKTLCNSCGLNWFRQRPMQREQVEVGNLMAAAVAAAALKRPANSLKDGPEKRKREEKKDGKQLREQLHGTKGAQAQQQPGAKRRKGDGGAGAGKPERAGGQAVASSLKGLQRMEKGSIRRKLGDAAVKKAALIKRTPSQLSLVGLLESAAAAPPAPPELPPAAAVKPTGVLKGARFSPLKQAQTRLGAQKLLAVLNVIKQKKGLGRVTSTASLESVPEEDPLAAQPDGSPGISGSGVPAGREVLASTQDALRGGWEPGPAGASARRPTKTGARSQRRPNTALLQGASFLPWKARPRGWESSSLTFAAAESRLLKSQAAAPAAHGRSPLQARAEAGPIGAGPEQEGVGGGKRGATPDPQQRARLREGGSHEAAAGALEAGEGGSDDDGFAGYGVLRKLLEEVDAPPTSPPAKGRPPLNKKGGAPLAKKPQRLEQPLGSQGPSARAGLSSYESFEDLVMGTAGGMKRFESFEDLALRAGPVFARVESFEELALRAGPAMRRFESFEDLAMRSQPVVEPPPQPAPSALPAAHVAGRGEGESSAEAGSEGEAGSRDGAGRRSGREKKQKTWEWAVVDGPKRRRKDARDDKGLPREGPEGPAPWRSGAAQGQRTGGPGQALQPPRGSQGRGRGGAPQSPGMLGPGESPTAGSLELGQRGEGTEEPVSAEGRLLAAPGQAGGLPKHSAAVAAAGQPGAALPPNGLRYAVRVPAAAQPSGSAGPTASLPRSVLGLGPRGVSARALHLLVDCAVEPEPAADVATLMADLQTLAIGNAAKRGGSNGGQEQGRGADGATGGLEAGFAASFTLPNGRAVKQVAPVAHAVRPPVGPEVAGDGAAEGRAGGADVEGGAPEAGPPAAEQEDGAVGPSKANPVKPRGAPAAVDKDARAAQPLQVPAGEPELHCAEVLQSPEDLPC